MTFDPWTVPDEHWVVAMNGGAHIWVGEEAALYVAGQLASNKVIVFEDVTGCPLHMATRNISHVFKSTPALRRRDQLCREYVEHESDEDKWKQ